jgi:hypothetical protein
VPKVIVVAAFRLCNEVTAKISGSKNCNIVFAVPLLELVLKVPISI